MDRRDFITSTAAIGALPLAAQAQARPKDVLIVANEIRPQLARHPHRRRQPAQLRRQLAGLRPADDLRQEDAARRRVSPTTATSSNPSWPRAGRSRPTATSVTFKLRRGRQVPRRHAGDRQGREVVLRPRGHRRRLPHLPDGRRLARKARAVRGGRRAHLPRQVPPQGQADDERHGRAGALHLQQRAGEEERHAGRTPGAWTGRASNVAGGGAYKVEAFRPGQEIVYVRNDDWKNGPLPKTPPHRAARRAQRRQPPRAAGQGRHRHDLRPAAEGLCSNSAQDKAGIKVASMPIENAMLYLGMNINKPPFDNPKVRQAVAYALPYDKIFENAFYGRAAKLYGGNGPVKTIAWPQPTAYRTDIAKAKALMDEAGVPERLRDHAQLRPGRRHRRRAGGGPDRRRRWRPSASRCRSTRSPAPPGARRC